jgi:two-component system response regulator
MDPITVMHIDDNLGDLLLAREALNAQGIASEGVDEPITAIGRLGRACIAGEGPSAILLDLRLAAMDGCHVLRLLASNRLLRRIPVIMLTSSDHVHEREECLRLGATSYIVKPATFEELSEALRRAIEELPQRGWKPRGERAGGGLRSADAGEASPAAP